MSGNPVSYALSIDWANAGSYPDNGDSAKLRTFSIKRGREQPFSGDPTTGEARLARNQIGQLTLTLDNEDGRYDTYNTSSPLYPNVTPGHVVRFQVTDDLSNTYTLFVGTIDDIQNLSYRHDARVQIVCSDYWKKLSQRPIASSFYSWRFNGQGNIQYANFFNDAGSEILASAGVSQGATYQISSENSYAVWAENAMPYQSLHDFAEMDGGYCWIATDGTFNFLNRITALAQTPVFTLDQAQVLNEPRLSQPWDNIINQVRMNVYDRTHPDELQVVWTAPTIPALAPGESLNYTMEFKGALNQVVPCGTTVNGRDFQILYVQLNTSGDGTGANMSLLTTQTYPPGIANPAGDNQGTNIHGGGATRAEFTFTNNSAQTGYLLALMTDPFIEGFAQGMTLFKSPYDALNPTETVVKDSTSITANGLRELRLDYPYTQGLSTATTIAQAYLDRFKNPKPVITVEIINRSTVQFAYDLYTLMNFTSTYLNKKYSNGCFDYGFRIISIQHESGQTPYEVKTTWVLEPMTNPSGIIPTSSITPFAGNYLLGALTY